MTEKEAIQYLETEKMCVDETSVGKIKKQMYEVAIKALEEVQEYRKIGTVENLKTLCDLFGLNGFKKLEEYQKIGTVEECRDAIEKQKPKKPDYEGDGYADGQLVYDTWICPNCGKRYEVDYDDYSCCPKCGQSIDRSDERD